MVKRKKPIGELVKLVDQEIHRTRCSINEAATRVADKNQVKKETLRKAYQRSRKNKSKKHGNQIFTDLTEKKLCSLILAFSTKGLALRRYLLLDFVKRTYNKGDKWNGSVWFRGFMERHAATLSYTKSKGLDIQRVHNVSKDIVDKFLTAYENVLETYKLEPDFIVNADESPCEISKSDYGSILRSAESATQGSVNLPKSCLRTILPFVAASGRVWLVVLIYKCMSGSDGSTSTTVSVPTKARVSRKGWPTYYATSAKGFITNELWTGIIATFIEVVKASARGKHVLLLLDRQTSHLEITSMKALIDSDIHPLYLPAHTTHIVQPLDNVILGGLKLMMRLKKSVEMLRRFILKEDMNSIIQDVFTDLGCEAFKPEIIQAGFRKTGVWPFDKKSILEHFENEYMWSKDEPVEETNEMSIKDMAEQFKEHLFGNTSNTNKRKVTVSEKGKLFTGEELVQYFTDKEHEKAEKEREKEEKKQQREEQKLKKDEEKKQKQELQAQKLAEKEQETQAKEESRNSRTCSKCRKLCRNTDNISTCEECLNYKLCKQCLKQDPGFEEHLNSCLK